MDIALINEFASFITLCFGLAGIFYSLRSRVRVLEVQLAKLESTIAKMEERNETLLDELRNDIKQLLSNR